MFANWAAMASLRNYFTKIVKKTELRNVRGFSDRKIRKQWIIQIVGVRTVLEIK